MKEKSGTPQNQTSNAPLKKAYSAPQTLSKDALEAMAVLCSAPGKADELNCGSGPITS